MTYLCLFFGCIVCPFTCFMVVLYWPWTLNLLCLYVHIQRWVQRVLCVCTSCANTGLGFELFVWTVVADFCELCSHVTVVPSMILLLCWIVCPGCWIVRPGCWIVCPGCWIVCPGCWIVCPGCWIVCPGCWIVCPGCSGIGSRIP